jgi:hypothetical protein
MIQQNPSQWVSTHFPVASLFPYYEVRHTLTPSFVLSSQGGLSGVSNTALGSQASLFGIQNNIAGYLVYVGYGSLPDLTQPATAFSLSLPISLPVSTPESGESTFYVLVRSQDTYGLVSQNQSYFITTINSSGTLVFPDLLPPQNLSLFELIGGVIRVLATYPGFGIDVYPAMYWKLWLDTVIPDTSDIPTLVVPVTGVVLATALPSQAPGTYYVAVGLYRSTDLALSSTVYSQITISSPPDQVVPVLSGFEIL